MGSIFSSIPSTRSGAANLLLKSEQGFPILFLAGSGRRAWQPGALAYAIQLELIPVRDDRHAGLFGSGWEFSGDG